MNKCMLDLYKGTKYGTISSLEQWFPNILTPWTDKVAVTRWFCAHEISHAHPLVAQPVPNGSCSIPIHSLGVGDHWFREYYRFNKKPTVTDINQEQIFITAEQNLTTE